MIQTIRRSHNYRKILLYANGKADNPGVTGNDVSVLRKDGGEKGIVFGGFRPRQWARELSDEARPIKITNVEAYSTCPKGIRDWHELPRDCLLLGALYQGKAYILHENDKPVVIDRQ